MNQLARNQAAGDLFQAILGQRQFLMAPPIEVLDQNDRVVVKAEMPGVDKKDIQVLFEDHHLVLKAESKKEEEVKDQDAYYSERTYGAIYRAVQLPAAVDDKKAKARFNNGVLTVEVPKSKEDREKTKTIAVE